VVHAAWPGQPHGSLLQVDGPVVLHQLQFGAMSTIELARFLFSHAATDEKSIGGRLIVLGSIAAVQKPVLPLASYSLGKAAVEQTVRLLAPELARRKITVNVISPSFIATGMNKQSSDRQQMKEAALVPLGRLCRTDDVEGLARFLLSAEAEFISGQTIGLTGAQL
jgi:3-oxoacyl-[acyl-carrier protein] reductase